MESEYIALFMRLLIRLTQSQGFTCIVLCQSIVDCPHSRWLTLLSAHSPTQSDFLSFSYQKMRQYRIPPFVISCF